jgi:hypothetical protein
MDAVRRAGHTVAMPGPLPALRELAHRYAGLLTSPEAWRRGAGSSRAVV